MRVVNKTELEHVNLQAKIKEFICKVILFY
jgi:hypothetical protein